MDINQIKSDMQLENLYFKKISFQRDANIADGNVAMNIKRHYINNGDNFEMILLTEIKKEDFSLTIEAVGNFLFNSNIEDEDVRNNMIKNNGAAIMFPFIRSQIAQVTAQPGMMPIVMPAVNVTKMIDE